MPYGYQSVPFWDFFNAMDDADWTGAGINQPASDFQRFGPSPSSAFGHGPGFFRPQHGFGGPGGCHRGRGHCRRHDGSYGKPPHCEKPDDGDKKPEDPEKQPGDPEKQPEDGENRSREASDPPNDGNAQGRPHGFGHGGPRHWRGRHGHGPWGRHQGPRPPFGGPAGAPFDMSDLVELFASHPISKVVRNFAEQVGQGAGLAKETDPENAFIPPIDVFSTPSAYILHVALPGAKKEDVGVNWDADKNELNVAGVVYRQGDEEFLKTLSKTERKVGVFERNIKLPPGEEEKEEVDAESISAKLEDGVLVITVPKVEKEWTEVKKVDIE